MLVFAPNHYRNLVNTDEVARFMEKWFEQLSIPLSRVRELLDEHLAEGVTCQKLEERDGGHALYVKLKVQDRLEIVMTLRRDSVITHLKSRDLS